MSLIPNTRFRIFDLRGEKVMLDFDLAELYEVATKVLNQAVKRNSKRFPPDFMFRLTRVEWQSMRSQFVTASKKKTPTNKMSSQKKRNSAITPFAFTEHGVAMLSSVLHSDTAITMNLAIMRAFVEIRKIALTNTSLQDKWEEIKNRLGEHDVPLSQIYDAIENLLDEKSVAEKWQDRERIGFKA